MKIATGKTAKKIVWQRACNRDDNRPHCCSIPIVVEECCKQPRSKGMVELCELLETIRRRAARKESLFCEETGGSDSTITDFMTDAFTADEWAATTTNGLVGTASMRTPAVTATALDTSTADMRAATTTNGLVRSVSMRTPAAIAHELDTFTADERTDTTTDALVGSQLGTAIVHITVAIAYELVTSTAMEQATAHEQDTTAEEPQDAGRLCQRAGHYR